MYCVVYTVNYTLTKNEQKSRAFEVHFDKSLTSHKKQKKSKNEVQNFLSTLDKKSLTTHYYSVYCVVYSVYCVVYIVCTV